MRNNSRSRVIQSLYRGVCPFAFFHPDESNIDLQGWGSNHPYLEEGIEKFRPSIIVEIGAWKGGSSIFMAEKLREFAVDGVILSVDTWLGAEDHWTNDEWFPSLRIEKGIPNLQETFMTNVCAKRLTDYILFLFPWIA